jgi:hypothetical protein
MKLVVLLVGSLIVTSPAFAQAATVSVFAPAVTNPNAATPLSSATYTPICNQAPAPEVIGTVTATTTVEGRYADPANAARDCVMDLTSQLRALSAGTGYRAAGKLGTAPFGNLSTAFAVAAAQTAHPCDTTPASPPTVNVGQPFTLGWCHPSRDTNGNTTTVSSWRVYRNGVLLPGVTVTAGTTTNAAGLRYYTAPRTETVAGPVSFDYTAVNAVGESAHSSPAIAMQVVPPATVPVAPSGGRITIP